jgi:hypothetical protein
MQKTARKETVAKSARDRGKKRTQFLPTPESMRFTPRLQE